MNGGAGLGLTVVVAVLSLAIGAAVGVSLRGCGGDEASAVPAEQQARLDHLVAENARLAARLTETEREAVREAVPANALPAAAPAEAAEAADGPASEAVAGEAEVAAPAFFADLYDGALGKVDWKLVGGNMHRMVGLIRELVQGAGSGRRPSPVTVGKIQELNGPLLTTAMQLGASIPGVGVNGKFTDPAFMVNAMASALAAAGLPLDTGQAGRLEEVARHYLARDERRRTAYTPETWVMVMLHEEAELKHAFFEDALAVLSPEQREALSPPETRDRLRADLFGAGLIYGPRCAPTYFQDRDGLVIEYRSRASGILGLSESERELADPIVRDWVAGLPQELLDLPVDELDRNGNFRFPRAHAWCRHTYELLSRVATRLGFAGDRLEDVRRFGFVLVPLKDTPLGSD